MADGKVKSIIMVIGIVLIILLVDITGGYIIGKKLLIPYAYNTDNIMGDFEDSGVEKDVTQSGVPGLLRELEAINLNPANSSGEIFSCQLTLEAPEQEIIDELTSRDPQVKDVILTYLSFKSVLELNDVSKRDEYRKELIDRINSILTTGNISNLYITQWILQFD